MAIVDIKESCYEKQLIYPGRILTYPWVCVRDYVYPVIIEENNIKKSRIIIEDELIEIEEYLFKLGSEPLEKRIPVIAFGANRNIENIVWKMRKYDVSNDVIIALPAYIENSESVVSGIFFSGHFYSDIIFNNQYCDNTVLEATLLLVSINQVYALNKSENVPKAVIENHWGAKLALIDTLIPVLGNRRIKALIYVSETIIMCHPKHKKPVAFRDVFAFNRKIPEYSQMQLYEEFLVKGEGLTKKMVIDILSDLYEFWNNNNDEKKKTYEYVCEMLKKYAWTDDEGNYINGEYLAKRDNLLLKPEEWWNIPKRLYLFNNLQNEENMKS